MDEENTISSKGDRRPRETVIRVGFELFIVFVGVWGALLAENWREKREEDRAAVAVIEAALTHIRVTWDWWDMWRDSVQAEYADWEAQRAQGEVIQPFFLRIPGGESPAIGIFGAASNLPDALGSPVVSEMVGLANEMEGVGIRMARYMELTERTVFQRSASDPSVFYDPVSGDLLPEYQGQLVLMEEVMGEWDRTGAQARRVEQILEQELLRRR
jgi:hypothetical protein